MSDGLDAFKIIRVESQSLHHVVSIRTAPAPAIILRSNSMFTPSGMLP